MTFLPIAVDPTTAPTVCRHLRSKGAGVIYGEPVRWHNGYFSSAVFWCLQTADALGPDDSFVHPHACVMDRACFQEQPVVAG